MTSKKDVTRMLESYGLTSQEVAVYLACLRGALTPTKLAQETGFKRNTVYLYVEALQEKGLLRARLHGRTKSLAVVPPRQSLTHTLAVERRAVAKREENLDVLVAALAAQATQDSGRAQTYVYSKRADLLTLIGTVVEAGHDVYWYGSFAPVLEHMTEDEFLHHMTWRRMDKRTTMYAITDAAYADNRRLAEPLAGFRKVKVLEHIAAHNALVAICGQHIVLASISESQTHVVHIVDAVTAALMRTFYLELWHRL